MSEAMEIYREAHHELNEADLYYSKAYDLRRYISRYGTNNFPVKQIVSWKKDINAYMRESSKHRRKYKSLMKKIKWDPNNEQYRLKSAAEKIAETARRK
jgi:hypothetical protein